MHAVWLRHDGGGVDRDAPIGHARSEDAGAAWTSPVAVHAPQDCPPGTPFGLDKPMIAVGPARGRPAQEAVRAFDSADAAGGPRMRSGAPGGACAGSVRASDGMAADELVRCSSKRLGRCQARLVDPGRRVLHSAWTQTVPEADRAMAGLRHATRLRSPRRPHRRAGGDRHDESERSPQTHAGDESGWGHGALPATDCNAGAWPAGRATP